jgi:hypothetical protein
MECNGKKRCSKCREIKDVNEFYKYIKRKAGRNILCNKCLYEYNSDRKKEIDKRYRLKNIDKVKEKEKRYRLENIDKVKEKSRRYYVAHKDDIKERVKIYQKINVDSLSNAYIKQKILRQFGIESTQIPEHIIDLKREQIELHRLIKEAKHGITR